VELVGVVCLTGHTTSQATVVARAVMTAPYRIAGAPCGANRPLSHFEMVPLVDPHALAISESDALDATRMRRPVPSLAS
jgi:hypothetical protein